MHATPTLATRFARNTRVLRGDSPLSEDQMRAAAPSVFAEGKHASRSERYTYIPTRADAVQAWMQLGTALAASGNPADRDLASSIARFVHDMPGTTTAVEMSRGLAPMPTQVRTDVEPRR